MDQLELLTGLPSQHTYVLGLSILLPLVIFLVISVKSYYRLSHIPGPFFARFTNIPRLLWVKSFNAHRIHIDLHKKYGPIVRFGPNMVSVGDPREIGTIYSFKRPWPKVRGKNKGSIWCFDLQHNSQISIAPYCLRRGVNQSKEYLPLRMRQSTGHWSVLSLMSTQWATWFHLSLMSIPPWEYSASSLRVGLLRPKVEVEVGKLFHAILGSGCKCSLLMSWES